MATKQKKSAAMDLGWQLGEVRQQLKELRSLDTMLTKAFKTALRDEELPEAGGYTLSTAQTLKVANIEAAWKWSDQYPATRKIDTALAREIFRKGQADPTKYGFEYVETERVVALKDVDKDE